MKLYLKILAIILLSVILTGCINNNNQNKKNTIETTNSQSYNKQTNNEYIDKKTRELEKKLENKGLSGNIIKKIIEKQKKGYTIINNLKGDEKIKYNLESKILPKLKKEGKLPKQCNTTNLNRLVTCIYATNTPLESLLSNLPEESQKLVKKTYYYKSYTIDKKNLLNPTSDPIALEQKKKVIKQLTQIGVIRNPTICNKFKEKEIKNYCISLFRK